MERHKSYNPFIVQLLREGLVESVHQAHVAVVDYRGRLLFAAGDPGLPVFSRSALKPFQALAVLRSGVQLPEVDMAILCSSHGGEISQCRQVFRLLWQAGLETDYLTCPTPSGAVSPLAHNCSGKHAGMLLACRTRGWSLKEYTSPRHPFQQFTGEMLGELLGLPVAELIIARDDCGAPTYQMALSQLARLYALLSSGSCPQMEALARAMVAYPDRVAGKGRFDTLLMQAAPHLVSKGGAEGVLCIAHLGEGMGMAVKIRDGAERAKYPVVLHLLNQLGWLDPEITQTLMDRFAAIDSVKRLEVAGEMDLI
ncbi:asparaginase [Anthocerotibacter panamensis]|uniref:asparaginase n=1 Tax=Anthocerotibacter panamensis TaxID=2857077 RepID=UPI001C4028D0|nr:asparaginase [Anthocerotibacter panamensis]